MTVLTGMRRVRALTQPAARPGG